MSWGFRPVLFCAARWKRSHALSGEMSLHISLLSCAGINVLLSAAGHCCSLAFGSRITSSLVCSRCYAATGIPRLICLEKEIHEELPKGICGRMYSRFSHQLGFVCSWNPDTDVVDSQVSALCSHSVPLYSFSSCCCCFVTQFCNMAPACIVIASVSQAVSCPDPWRALQSDESHLH